MELNSAKISIKDLNSIKITASKAVFDCGEEIGQLTLSGEINILSDVSSKNNNQTSSQTPEIVPAIHSGEIVTMTEIGIEEMKTAASFESQDIIKELEKTIVDNNATYDLVVKQLKDDLETKVQQEQKIKKEFDERVVMIKNEYERKLKLEVAKCQLATENYEGLLKYGKAFRTSECYSVTNKSYICNRKDCRFYHNDIERRYFNPV